MRFSRWCWAVALVVAAGRLWAREPVALSPAEVERGLLWDRFDLAVGTISPVFQLEGFDARILYLTGEVECDLEVRRLGRDDWTKVDSVAAHAGEWMLMPLDFVRGRQGRLVVTRSEGEVTAFYDHVNRDRRSSAAAVIFDGLVRTATSPLGDVDGVFGAAAGTNSIALVETTPGGAGRGFRLTADLALHPESAPAAVPPLNAMPSGTVLATLADDAASLVVTDVEGRRWRLPRLGPAAGAASRLVAAACPGLDVLNAGGTFYELPRSESGGAAEIRPIATHAFMGLRDFTFWNGRLLMTGVERGFDEGNRRLLADETRTFALWTGLPSELPLAGKPRGQGGPWMKTAVKAGEVSDPYLMHGFDRKLLLLAADRPLKVRLELDVTGRGHWAAFKEYTLVGADRVLADDIRGVRARWLRVVAGSEGVVTAQLIYR